VIPSCGDSGDEGSGFQDLFIDDFDTGLGAWTIVSPSVTIDGAGIGRGPAMLATAQAGVPAEADTTMTFAVGPGLGVSVDIVVGASIGEFQIVDSGSPAVRDTYVIITDNSAHFSIQGVTFKLDFKPDSHVHKYLFHAQNGLAIWQRDGITYLQSGYGASTVFIALRDLESGSKFDLVHVNTP
jgi:hypothetical protein